MDNSYNGDKLFSNLWIVVYSCGRCGSCFGMANMELSLDDIIQKKFSKNSNIRGRRRYVQLCYVRIECLWLPVQNVPCLKYYPFGMLSRQSSYICILRYMISV
jgi:hypothetical protein